MLYELASIHDRMLMGPVLWLYQPHHDQKILFGSGDTTLNMLLKEQVKKQYETKYCHSMPPAFIFLFFSVGD